MPNGSMQLDEFQDLLDRKGPAIGDWPAADRERADRLLQASVQARAILDEAILLRDAVHSAGIRAPASLRDAVIRAACEPRPRPLPVLVGDWLRSAFMPPPPPPRYSALFLLTCLIVGLLFGLIETATAPAVRLEFTAIPVAFDPRAL